MKALVYYCRWQGVVLRLRGRDETAVWGHLVSTNEAGHESSQPFRFELDTNRLTLSTPAGEQTISLDEMGTKVA
ncbi:MAG: hypothetical protein R6X32_16400 [Chloroflexota bacterium]|jgi:hypothetical protein